MPASATTEELLDEIARLLALAIRRGMENQAEAIREFLAVGIEPTRVAALLGTTPATVRATRAAAQKAATKKRNPASG